MNIELIKNMSSPCTHCSKSLFNGNIGHEEFCESCEFTILTDVLTHILKVHDHCNMCINCVNIKGGFTDCKLGFDSVLECGYMFEINWEKLIKEYFK